jgi:sugar lactone lactonase YvrE
MRGNLATVFFLLAMSNVSWGQIVSIGFFNSSINQYSVTGSGLQGVLNAPGANGVTAPGGVTVAPNGDIYFSGTGNTAANNAVYKYDRTSGVVSTFISAAALSAVTGGNPYGPTDLLFGPDGNLYIARSVGQGSMNIGNGTVDRWSPTGSFITTIAAGLTQPTGMTIRGSELFVSELGGPNPSFFGKINRIADYVTATPTVSTFVTPNSGGLVNPTGMAFGPDGNLYVADVEYFGASGVRAFTSTGAPIAANNMVISLPFSFTSDVMFANDQLIVGNLGNPFAGIPGSIVAYDPSTFAFENSIITEAGVGFGALAFNPNPLVPEPTLLAAIGLVGIVAIRRRG